MTQLVNHSAIEYEPDWNEETQQFEDIEPLIQSGRRIIASAARRAGFCFRFCHCVLLAIGSYRGFDLAAGRL